MADGQFEVREFLLPMHLIANRAWCKIFIYNIRFRNLARIPQRKYFFSQFLA